MTRHTRRQEIGNTDRQTLIEDLTAFHKALQSQMCKLRPASLHYKQLLLLSDQVVITVRAVTGRDPEWMHT